MTPPGLEALRDIHPPPPPLVMELAVGGAAAALLLALVFVSARSFRQRRSLRSALRELQRLAAAYAGNGDSTRLVSALSRLLRSYALARFPGRGIEGLTGSAWLRFLDEHGGGGDFSAGVGAALASRPYQNHGAVDAAALIELLRRWLKANPV